MKFQGKYFPWYSFRRCFGQLLLPSLLQSWDTTQFFSTCLLSLAQSPWTMSTMEIDKDLSFAGLLQYSQVKFIRIYSD